MSITKAVGTGVDIAKTYGSSKNMTAISNANPAVATLESSHGVIVGDVIEITSGWGKLNGRVVRVSVVNTNDVTLEGVNTSSATDYPAGSGVGTVREITDWQEITQRTPNMAINTGQPVFADITTLQDTEERKLPVRRGATDMSLPGFFDLSAAWVAYAQAATDSGAGTGLRVRYPNGNKLYANAYWNISDGASGIEDFTLRDSITLTFVARSITYAT